MGIESDGSIGRKGTYVRGREIVLFGGEAYGWDYGEVTALVLVKDASKD